MSVDVRRVAALLALALGSSPAAAPAQVGVPVTRGPALRIQLFAREPQIVTPIGVAVDGRGRVFVVESHTHMPPTGYVGPTHDRVKILEDTDGDGQADRVTIFADGPFRDAMSLAFARDGTLYVVTQSAVLAMRDTSGDAHADWSRVVLRLETKQRYPHSGLLGAAVSPDGWLYVSRGNIGGYEYAFVGSDGRRLPGYGDGGDIVRVRLDGSRLERVATGFWNPFGLTFDGAGRLLASDNDPDSRGPNRLVHVIPGGDYGYRARFGGSGLHPHSAWAGELPGTLGFISGVGESPAGVIDASSTALPLAGDLLVASWAENSIERLRVARSGVSLTARREVLVKGDANFRPVALAAAPDGAMYVSDWVKKDYPNHGLGRVWRITGATGARHPALRSPLAPPRPDPGVRRLAGITARGRLVDYEALRGLLGDADPFVRAAALGVLVKPVFRARLLADVTAASAAVRLGALLALRRSAGPGLPAPPPPRGLLERLLGDPDEEVRKAALVWAGEVADPALRPALVRAIRRSPVSTALVRIYLASSRLVSADERAHLLARAPRSTAEAVFFDPDAVETLLADRELPPEVQALALPFLPRPHAPEHLALLSALVRDGVAAVRLEAVRSLAGVTASKPLALLSATAHERGAPATLRAEAMLALAATQGALAGCVDLLDDPAPEVQLAAARLLRGGPAAAPATRAALDGRLERARAPGGSTPPALLEALAFAVEPERAFDEGRRPATAAAWHEAVGTGGDPAAGRVVFANPQIACTRCHAVDGRGGAIGPDLSHLASSVDRARMLDSILEPSAEVSPEYQTYAVRKKSGEELIGSQWHLRGDDRATLRLVDGTWVTFTLGDLASYGPSEGSFMPQGLEQAMTVSELRDLLAYLSTRR
jgi:putative membrane-bound dehydrogenase-like protein